MASRRTAGPTAPLLAGHRGSLVSSPPVRRLQPHRPGRIRLEAQDTALSRRRSPVRIRYAVPTLVRRPDSRSDQARLPMFRVRLNPYPNPCTRSHSCRRQDRRRVRGTPPGSHIGLSRASMSQEGARARRRISVARRPNSGIHDRGHGRVPDAISCRAADPESGTRNQPREPRFERGAGLRRPTGDDIPGSGRGDSATDDGHLHRKCTSVDRPLHEH